MNIGLITSPDLMDEKMRLGTWECKVFCEKHKRVGCKKVKKIKNNMFS
jgi:hypothetical protein